VSVESTADRSVGALAGVRVLTVDNFLAGNYGPLLLAMHGAEVVKIEQPGTGDTLRRDAPFLDAGDRLISHGELRLLRGKASAAIDIRSSAGRKALDRLIASADVFWTNLRPASALRLRIDYDSLRSINSRLIYASVSGFGLPLAHDERDDGRPAFDIIVQALTGLMSRNANPDGEPQYNGIPVADQVTSLYAAMGVVLALFDRKRTGRGQCVDVSMFDSMVALNEKTLSLYAMDGVVRPPRISATNSPFGAYPARDGFIVIGVGGNRVWERFCGVIGRSDLIASAELDTGVKRVNAEATVIRPIVEGWLKDKTVDQAVSLLLAADVPASAVHEVDRVLRSEGAHARGVLRDVDLGGRVIPLVQSPIRLSDSNVGAVDPPHVLGADTERVLMEWSGLTKSEIATLRQEGAIP
jgi:CoA:oxalate CoA-transferase